MGEGSRLAVFIAILCVACAEAQQRYFGKEVGALSELHHGVRGRVYAVDARTLYLRDFHYDGEGPAAYFYVGSSKAPGAGGTRLRDERGSTGPLRRYRGEGVTLALPDGTTLKDVRWFSVWCDEYSVNFGDVSLPRELEHPRPARLGALRGVHGVSSDPLVVVDAQTLLLPNFSYDGEAPDAKFWVGRGEKPSPAGIRIPDENGKEAPLRRYDKKTIVLTLPGELTVFDIGHFAVWCEAFTVNFGHVVLPRAALANVPPSLKMLGVSPQSRNKALSAGTSPRPRPRPAIARLDATTYRPRTPGHLHRRADTYTPPQEQLIQDQPNHQQYQQQSEQFQVPQQQFHNVQQQPELFQQQIQQQNQQQQYHDIQQQQPFQNAQQIQQNYQLYNPNQLNYQQLLLQQQLYEQQRLLLEQQLRNEQYRLSQLSDQGPVQYHLLPHQNERKHREAETEVTIQKSVDLDLNAGLRS